LILCGELKPRTTFWPCQKVVRGGQEVLSENKRVAKRSAKFELSNLTLIFSTCT